MGTHPIFESDFDCLTEMGRTEEICFEAPEISMSSDITIDAILSMVTVSKLTNMSVNANCYCPGKEGSANTSNNNNRNNLVTPPLDADPAPAEKPVVAQDEPALVSVPDDPAPAEPAKSEPAQADPVPEEPAQAEPAQPEPSQSEPAQADPAPEEPAQAEPVQEDPAPAESAPVEPEVAAVEPAPAVQAEPKAEPENVEPVEIPSETPGAINTADETSASIAPRMIRFLTKVFLSTLTISQ